MGAEIYPLADAIATTLARTPDQFAVEFEGHKTSWGEMAAVGDQLEALLQASGVDRDWAIGLVLRNHPVGYAALAGLVAARRQIAPISPFQDSRAIAADIAKLKLAAVVASVHDWAPPVVEAANSAGSAAIAVDGRLMAAAMVSGSSRFDSQQHPPRMRDTAMYMLTSGTTGTPKRVRLSRTGLSSGIADQVRMAAAMGEAPPGAGLAGALIQYAPMVQLSGLYCALQAASEGRPLIMMEKFSAAEWIRAVRTYRQHMLGLPPAMMRMVLDAEPSRDDLSSLRSVRSGAAPLDAHTRDAFEELYEIPVLSNYGATEFVGAIASWSLHEHALFGVSKRGSVGRVWSDMAQARIVDVETGAELPRGESGVLEVLVARAGSEWIRTNDLATLDEDDFLFIHGRADDAINRGGFKIPPDVISDALRTHPAVYDAVAIPLPDKRLGQVPVAAVELRRGAGEVTEAQLLVYARSRLMAYQVPLRILVVPALPRTPSQKISRPGVYALFEEVPQASA
jgi:long-chain acyl-CoA synthetase